MAAKKEILYEFLTGDYSQETKKKEWDTLSIKTDLAPVGGIFSAVVGVREFGINTQVIFYEGASLEEEIALAKKTKLEAAGQFWVARGISDTTCLMCLMTVGRAVDCFHNQIWTQQQGSSSARSVTRSEVIVASIKVGVKFLTNEQIYSLISGS